MPAQRHPLFQGAATALLAMLILGCQPEPTIPEVTLRAQDFAFVLPDTVAGGLLRFHFVNDGQEPHHAQLLRLNDGVTRVQFDSAFAAIMEAVPTEGEVAFMRIFQVATAAGGPGVIAPGRSTDVTLEVAPGNYVLMCFIASPDGLPHVVKGMTRWLTVTEPAADAPEPPVAAGRVDMADFAFAAMPPIDSGPVTLEVTNSGQEPHEMAVIRLEGVTLQQLMPMLAGPPPEGGPPPGPPPFTFMGGLQAIMPGQRGWVALDLPPGDYALICFIPSPANAGQPHAALGMVRGFTVD